MRHKQYVCSKYRSLGTPPRLTFQARLLHNQEGANAGKGGSRKILSRASLDVSVCVHILLVVEQSCLESQSRGCAKTPIPRATCCHKSNAYSVKYKHARNRWHGRKSLSYRAYGLVVKSTNYSIIMFLVTLKFVVWFDVLFLFGVCMAINVSVQYDCGFLPDIILATQCYYHRGTRLNAMKRLCLCSLSMIPPKSFDIFPPDWRMLRYVQIFL